MINRVTIRTNIRGQTPAEILEASIAAGRARAGNIFESIERTVPSDAVVNAGAMRFGLDGTDGLRMRVGDREWTLHRNAMQQICDHVGMPIRFADDLAGGGSHRSRSLLLHNLDELSSMTGGRRLVRSVDVRDSETGCLVSQARGFLSDRYKRIDSRAVVETFGTAVQKIGAEPYADTRSGLGAYSTDLQWSISAIVPRVYALGPSDAIAVGVQLRHSDFGRAPLALSMYVVRLFCLNGATMQSVLREVHLGKQLEADGVEYSDRTMRLTTAASVSQLRDAVTGVLGEAHVAKIVETIEGMSEREVTWAQASRSLGKKLTKAEQETVRDLYEGTDIVNLPEGRSAWRLSNALSWLAKDAKEDRALELERMAGEVIDAKAA